MLGVEDVSFVRGAATNQTPTSQVRFLGTGTPFGCKDLKEEELFPEQLGVLLRRYTCREDPVHLCGRL